MQVFLEKVGKILINLLNIYSQRISNLEKFIKKEVKEEKKVQKMIEI